MRGVKRADHRFQSLDPLMLSDTPCLRPIPFGHKLFHFRRTIFEIRAGGDDPFDCDLIVVVGFPHIAFHSGAGGHFDGAFPFVLPAFFVAGASGVVSRSPALGRQRTIRRIQRAFRFSFAFVA